MLSQLLTLSALCASVSFAAFLQPRDGTGAYCAKGNSCFPTQAQLAAFNTSIGGRLYSARPISSVCYAKDPSFSPAACANLQANNFNDQFRSDNFGAFEQTQWEDCNSQDQCGNDAASFAAGTCGQGRIPDYFVNAASVSDIQAWAAFVYKYNLRPTIKNTGHDYKGRSAGDSGFGLWTHGMTGATHSTSFTPKGCSQSYDAITLLAGTQWRQGYQFADSVNRTLVGGDNPQVGAVGGWLAGGGHSFLSTAHGLGVDRVISIDLVTPTGSLQTVTSCSNPELFRSLRGGGGGTFGVVASATYQTLPRMQIHALIAPSLSLGLGNKKNNQVLGALAKVTPALNSNGIGGVCFIGSNASFTLLAMPDDVGNMAKFQSLTKPFADSLVSLGLLSGGNLLNGNAGAALYQTYDSYYDFFSTTFGTFNEQVGVPIQISSRLIPTHYFQSNPQGVADVVQASLDHLPASSSPGVQILMGPPGPLAGGDKGVTSVNPVWYKSAWHVIPSADWAPNAPAATQQAVTQAVWESGQMLRAFAPDGGAYQNEVSPYETDYKVSFWGSQANYNRLLAAKQAVDPKGLFEVWNGVGAGGIDSPRYSRCYKQNAPQGYSP